MGKVPLGTTISPDGFIAGPNEDVALRIQDWAKILYTHNAAFQICLQY
jgi:hypothetical protein